MRQEFGEFETERVVYKLAMIFFGWPMIAWAFLIWCFNVLVLRRNPYARFPGTLGILEISPAIRSIRSGSATWRALHIIYNWYGHFGIKPDLPRDPFAWFWIRNANGQAVRNRLRIIVAELKKAIIDVSSREEEVRILSVASGSAQSLFLAVNSLRRKGFKKRVKLLLLDLDHSALRNSAQLAEHWDFPAQDIIYANATTTSIEKLLANKDFKPQIIEMAGLLDYLRDGKAAAIMNRIYNILPPCGWFITCHVHPNMEEHFLRWAICWAMLYRKREDFIRLVQKSAPWKIRTVTEPHGIHTVAICKKEAKGDGWEDLQKLNAMPIHLERWQRSREREEELLSRGDQIEKGALGKGEQKQMKKIIQCLKALVWNEKALRIWPEDLNPEEIDKALAFINKAIELDPAYYMLYLNRGDMYAEQLDPELALLDYAEAIQLNPTCGRAYSMQAIIHAAHYDRKTLACMEAKKACELGECQAIEFLISMGECITAVK